MEKNMKLSTKTVNILKNFSSINNGIIISAGTELKTVSIARTVLALATIPDEFPIDFAIYDLNEFLNTLSLFDDPELTFEENYVSISSGQYTTKYYYSEEKLIQTSTKDFRDSDTEAKFELPVEILEKINKASAVMDLPIMRMSHLDENVLLVLGKENNVSEGNTYTVKVASIGDDFKVAIAMEKLRILPYDYEVGIIDDAILEFNNEAENITYWMSVDE